MHSKSSELRIIPFSSLFSTRSSWTFIHAISSKEAPLSFKYIGSSPRSWKRSLPLRNWHDVVSKPTSSMENLSQWRVESSTGYHNIPEVIVKSPQRYHKWYFVVLWSFHVSTKDVPRGIINVPEFITKFPEAIKAIPSPTMGFSDWSEGSSTGYHNVPGVIPKFPKGFQSNTISCGKPFTPVRRESQKFPQDAQS